MGRYEIRPLGTWLDPVTTDRKRGTFRAPGCGCRSGRTMAR
jgi:hypothetical protein